MSATTRIASLLPAAGRAAIGHVLWRVAAAADPHAVRSYGQEGEDLILRRLLGAHVGPGFYVDVGAHHPERFSNTRLFYDLGWRGINVEPNPAAAAAFASRRPRDVNLAVGVADEPGELAYYEFDDPALNTFDGAQARRLAAETRYAIVRTRLVPVRRLDEILRAHVPAATTIDFMTVDVEGFDLSVLRSNDWDRFRPAYVVVEAQGESIASLLASPTHRFLEAHRYDLVAKTAHTLVYGAGSATPDGGRRGR